MMRASHSSYWSLSGGWRASISLSQRLELGLATARKVAAHQSVEIVLERADLVGRPFLGQGGEGVRRGAGAVIVEGRGVAPERNVDGERDLLDRAHAVEPMRADVARQIKELLGREVGGGDALEDLLVGRVGRLGRASVLADQGLDRRPIDDPSTQRGGLRADGQDRKALASPTTGRRRIAGKLVGMHPA